MRFLPCSLAMVLLLSSSTIPAFGASKMRMDKTTPDDIATAADDSSPISESLSADKTFASHVDKSKSNKRVHDEQTQRTKLLTWKNETKFISSRVFHGRRIAAAAAAATATATATVNTSRTNAGISDESDNLQASYLSVDTPHQPRKPALPIYFFHKRHEGSNAITAYLSMLPCVFNFVESISYHLRNVNHLEPYRIFSSEDGIDYNRLCHILHHRCPKNAAKLAECRQNNEQEYVSALFLYYDFSTSHPELSIKRNAPFVVVIRRDLMRKALSISKTEAEYFREENPHLRGEGGDDKGKELSLAVKPFPLDDVKQRAHGCIDDWKEQLALVEWLTTEKSVPCKNIRIVFYEDFLNDSFDFSRRLYEFSTGKVLQQRSFDTNFADNHPQRIHTTDISQFVENHLEISEHFLSAGYPDFDSLLQEKDLICAKDELMLY